MVTPSPTLAEVDGTQYRIVPSEFPPINFFETLVEPERMEELFYLEGLTNDRLREEVGDTSLVAAKDRVTGAGSSPVMAAFTHIGNPSRFSDGSYGVYYAGRDMRTAIEETKFHRARFLAYTNEDPGEIEMRVYIGRILKPLHDIRGTDFEYLHQPEDWTPSQVFGRALRDERSWGLVYRSVRRQGGECIAALRPPAVSIPEQGPHLGYVWDGRTIIQVNQKEAIL